MPKPSNPKNKRVSFTIITPSHSSAECSDGRHHRSCRHCSCDCHTNTPLNKILKSGEPPVEGSDVEI